MISRRSDEQYYLDLGYQAEDGAFYIGASSAEELCRLMGWVSPEEVADLSEELEKITNERDNLRSVLGELSSLMGRLPAILKAYRKITSESTTDAVELGETSDRSPE